ncbi:MAG: hypothetical protein HY851_00315 [candidate division Zixibacteria bacterium]|nr:hypothetical protein [candidate division Zixibacteria bacterium]
MSKLRVGIDLRGSAILLVRADCGSGAATITALGKYSEGEKVPAGVLAEAVVTMGIPDPQTQTKIVQVCAVGAEHQSTAARFETTAGLLDADTNFAVTVLPVGLPPSGNDPTQWLGMAVRKARLQSAAARWLGNTPADPSPGFLARGVALGQGYMHFCEAEPGESTVICDLGPEHTAICFLKTGSIAGTATLRPLPIRSLGESAIREWVSELETLIRYRTIGGSTPPARSSLVLAGERVGEADNLQKQFDRPCSVARLRPEYLRSEAGGVGLSVDWLVALGLTVN